MQTQTCLAAVLALSIAAALYAAVNSVHTPLTVSPAAQRLREANYFAAADGTEPRPQLLAYTPQYPLWSDGADKRRWIELPPGTYVDASDPDAWAFPAGTRLWKEFSLGRRIETRLIERLADGTWRYATYVWDASGTDAMLAPEDGIPALPTDVPDRTYAIPSQYDCRACHEGARVPVLGFSALQLSDDRDPAAVHAEVEGATIGLRELVRLGALRHLPHELIEYPPRIVARSVAERAALGYLHGNCGHCHGNPDTNNAAVPVQTRLAQEIADSASTEHVLRSLTRGPSRYHATGAHVSAAPVVPGDAASSVLVLRMGSRDARVQMPPLGTSLPDPDALALIERWINHDLRNEESTP